MRFRWSSVGRVQTGTLVYKLIDCTIGRSSDALVRRLGYETPTGTSGHAEATLKVNPAHKYRMQIGGDGVYERESDGGVSESWAPRGHGSAVHIHSREDEAFFVVDGEIRSWFDDEPPFTRGAGELVWLPRARKHAFTVTSATARFLVLTTPAGFERLFETGTAAADAAIPPSGAMTDDEQERAAAALADVGVTVVGPPHAV